MNKEDWMRRVANLLGYRAMPADVAAHADYLRDQRASPEYAAAALRELLAGSPHFHRDRG